MRILLGLLAITASSAALSSWYLSNPVDSGLAVVTGVSSKGVARLEMPATSSTDTEQPRGPRFFGFALPAAEPAAPAVLTKRDPAERANADVAARGDPGPIGWSADVVIYPGGKDDAALVPSVVAATVPPRVVPVDLPRPPVGLVRELQNELRRVGCYQGDTDGDWGPGSRRAMRAFMERVSSGSPSETPDLVQLTLVRGFRGTACSASPVPGQMVAGRTELPVAGYPVRQRAPVQAAVPPVPVQVAGPPGTPAVAPASPPASVVAARPPAFDGRMSVGAPMPPEAERGPPASLVAPPAGYTAQPRGAAPRSQTAPRPRPRRADSNWTRNFFDQ
jgi:hypothetical protein